MITLEHLNLAPAPEFVAALGSIFEHSPWIPARITGARPFTSVLALHGALSTAVLEADAAAQLALIREHPELAGRAAVRGELTAASTGEQLGAGLSTCTPAQLARLQTHNAAYAVRFGFPFVLAVKGHTPDSVIAEFERRLPNAAADERRVALQEICRIAFFRLADLVTEPPGAALLAMADDLARFSDEPGALTCTYLTPAHRATAARIREFMLAAGLAAHIDAVGNVVGVLPGGAADPAPGARRLLTGSHYDTVINGGRYDGRLGILLPILVAGTLRRAGVRLPYELEIIAFAEEEGVRFKSTFLGSRAVCGLFEDAVLERSDAGGTTLGAALAAAGHDAAAIGALARDPRRVSGFVEVHIEQGPVLLEAGRAVGVVTGIAGSRRSVVTVTGLAGHAGTVPMGLRRDAAAAAAEIVLAVERRCSGEAGLVGTVGQLTVPGGAMNVIAGRCELSIDLRSSNEPLLAAAEADLGREIDAIAARRRVSVRQERVVQAAGIECTARLRRALGESVRRVTGTEAAHLPSGAGHDAMMMARLTDVGMLFVRCGNGGISHHPAESLSATDAGIAAQVFEDFLQHVEVCE